MPLFTWSNQYSVGVKSIDSQHINLFNMMNDLEVAMKSGKGQAVVGPLLRKLYDYTDSHFKAEERMMEKAQYVGLEQHRSKHVALTSKVKEFLDRVDKGGISVNVELIFFMCDWLKSHIMEHDKAYSPSLIARGVQ
jgi:hemerythrin